MISVFNGEICFVFIYFLLFRGFLDAADIQILIKTRQIRFMDNQLD